MALGGYVTLTREEVKGILPKESYKEISQCNLRTKGLSSGERTRIAKDRNRQKMLRNRQIPWADEEKYLVWLAMYSPTMINKRGGVKRKELVDLLNKTFHNSKEIRNPTTLKNIVFAYRNLRDLILY